ncbi:16S rRNA (cytidine(1402)-2'-O)-methyltransferase [Maricaulis parjimensis]|uniref:16S rRNA (cytidine(1402)-2'-O)-methyltransferase n=1 Tax=Maricaulis parjimensis TaxID=144023 RepID=UPI0019396987|nr:16S rRNA (cytidine(1402)-2'-O)-methyltransferase [Maricaulis parjimensis]
MTGTPSEIQGEASRHRAAGQALAPGLYLVATPIGNLRDITLRALDVLAAADRVLAEDTRVTRRLLDAHGIRAELQPYHDHNGEKVRPGILDDLAAGGVIALVSDAGTPLVSDPGFKLAREAIARDVDVIAIPGASAVLTALSIAGLPTDCFTFAGFPPQKTGARETWLSGFADVPGSLVIYEGNSRLPASLASMLKVLGDRPAAVCRELTKLHEEARRGTLSELAAHYEEAGSPRGEIVIVVGPKQDQGWDEARIDAALGEAMTRLRVKDAASEIAAESGWSRRDVYARAQALKDAAG